MYRDWSTPPQPWTATRPQALLGALRQVTFSARFWIETESELLRVLHDDNRRGHLICAAASEASALVILADAAALMAPCYGRGLAARLPDVIEAWRKPLCVLFGVSPRELVWVFTGRQGEYTRVQSMRDPRNGQCSLRWVPLTSRSTSSARLLAGFNPFLAPRLLGMVHQAAERPTAKVH